MGGVQYGLIMCSNHAEDTPTGSAEARIRSRDESPKDRPHRPVSSNAWLLATHVRTGMHSLFVKASDSSRNGLYESWRRVRGSECAGAHLYILFVSAHRRGSCRVIYGCLE